MGTTRTEPDRGTHTPGPWFVEHTLTCGHRIVHGEIDADTGFRDDVRIGFGTLGPSDEERANARLMSAAPDLLAAHIEIDALMGDSTLDPMQKLVRVDEIVTAAIERATKGGTDVGTTGEVSNAE